MKKIVIGCLNLLLYVSIFVFFLTGNKEYLEQKKKEDCEKCIQEIPSLPAVIVFENQNTACFFQKEMGVWCVDKTIKDTWDHPGE